MKHFVGALAIKRCDTVVYTENTPKSSDIFFCYTVLYINRCTHLVYLETCLSLYLVLSFFPLSFIPFCLSSSL
jgi:hypothetical protein